MHVFIDRTFGLGFDETKTFCMCKYFLRRIWYINRCASKCIKTTQLSGFTCVFHFLSTLHILLLSFELYGEWFTYDSLVDHSIFIHSLAWARCRHIVGAVLVVRVQVSFTVSYISRLVSDTDAIHSNKSTKTISFTKRWKRGLWREKWFEQCRYWQPKKMLFELFELYVKNSATKK